MPWEVTLPNAGVLAVHAALLPSGKILYFGGSEHNRSQNQSGNASDLDNTRIYDPVAPASPAAITSPTTDVFCSGHAFLGDGRLLVAGGTQEWGGDHAGHGHNLNFLGERASWIYHPRANRWGRVRDMGFEPGTTQGGGRWYPSLVTLANGEVLAVSGHPLQSDSRHNNDSPERYIPAIDHWAMLDATRVAPGDRGKYYPRLHLLPDATVFFTTPSGGSCRRYDPGAGAWAGTALPAAGLARYEDGWDFASVLLPLLPGDDYRARVLVCGDERPRIIDPLASGATWANAATRTLAGSPQRRFGMAILLPTGQVFVTGGIDGGSSDANAVLASELYRPGIDWATRRHDGNGAWENADAAVVVRNYHSTALLQPDGRVWTAGSSRNADAGDPSTVAEMRVEVYKPPYDGAAGRPSVTQAPPSVGYGQRFVVRSPEASQIRRVAFIRCGSVTHAFDSDQRYVGANFQHVGGDELSVTAPPHGAVAPPGHYMLWILDDANRPCRQAPILRLCDQRLLVITDRSTFSTHEVQALGGSATFANAFYVVLDGFLPTEAGVPLVTPGVTFAWSDGTTVPGMRAELNRVEYEDPSVPPDIAQRITFVFNLRFDNADAFAAIPVAAAFRSVRLLARHGANEGLGEVVLTKNPNPYLRDGPVHWLSTDLRAFALTEGTTFGGVTLGSGGGAPLAFVNALLSRFATLPADEDHPFLGISTDPEQSQLHAASHVAGQPVHNFAVAKVRFRAPAGVDAVDTRVFFRLFTTAVTGLEYTPTAYPRVGDGAGAVPMLGLLGSEILSIPFYAEARRADLRDQVDPTNRKTLAGAGSSEVVGYFGCWLDFNQPDPRFPLGPSHDGRNGPFTGTLLSLQQLLRNHHCCLAAEVHHPLDPIPAGATPGSHENLAQRNLIVVPSENPGSAATHTVQSTFDTRPSRFPALTRLALGRSPLPDDALAVQMDEVGVGPDELLIRWGNVPRDARAVIFLPGVDVHQVALVAARRGGPVRLVPRDDHTLVCTVGDTTWIPLPGPQPENLAGLLTLELPPTVTDGQHFRLSVHQVTSSVVVLAPTVAVVDHVLDAVANVRPEQKGRSRVGVRRIIGAFEIDIPVHHGPALVSAELDRLAVLKHIGEAIPAGNRWQPVFVRYLDQVGDRVRGLGVDPDDVPPSPTGSTRPETERPPQPEEPHDGGFVEGSTRVEGWVHEITYDRCGRPRSVVLRTCTSFARIRLCGRGLDEVLARACRDDLLVRVSVTHGLASGLTLVCC